MAVLVAIMACSRGRVPGAGESQPADPATVRVNVSNGFNLSMEVYVTGSGSTHRLGLVSSGIDRVFVLPPNMVGEGPVEFGAQPSGGTGPRVRSVRLTLSRGDIVDFVITASLFDSRATIRQ